VTPQEAIEVAELAEAETCYRNQLAREMYARGHERGLAEGYARAVGDVKAAQQGIVRDVELEVRRYGPGGREHFADPRPGDFPGHGAQQAEPEPELELEAG
jgi:hypothetical protein